MHSYKNLPQCHSVHHKYTEGVGLKPSASGERRWTNRLSHEWPTPGPRAQFTIQRALLFTYIDCRPVRFPLQQATSTAPSVINMETDSVFCSNTELVHTSHHLDKLLVTGNCTSSITTARHSTHLACQTNTRPTRVVISPQPHAV